MNYYVQGVSEISTCVNFNQWKNSPIYKISLYNILQNSLVFQDFLHPIFTKASFCVIN
jgi:hypothetical protein